MNTGEVGGVGGYMEVVAGEAGAISRRSAYGQTNGMTNGMVHFITSLWSI